jgi:hypothetical protein
MVSFPTERLQAYNSHTVSSVVRLAECNAEFPQKEPGDPE